jgi:hypothetical protein
MNEDKNDLPSLRSVIKKLSSLNNVPLKIKMNENLFSDDETKLVHIALDQMLFEETLRSKNFMIVSKIAVEIFKHGIGVRKFAELLNCDYDYIKSVLEHKVFLRYDVIKKIENILKIKILVE